MSSLWRVGEKGKRGLGTCGVFTTGIFKSKQIEEYQAKLQVKKLEVWTLVLGVSMAHQASLVEAATQLVPGPSLTSQTAGPLGQMGCSVWG